MLKHQTRSALLTITVLASAIGAMAQINPLGTNSHHMKSGSFTKQQCEEAYQATSSALKNSSGKVSDTVISWALDYESQGGGSCTELPANFLDPVNSQTILQARRRGVLIDLHDLAAKAERLGSDEQARQAHQRACDSFSNQKSCFKFARLAIVGRGGPVDYTAARNAYAEACGWATTEYDGCYDYSEMLRLGMGGPQDLKDAQLYRAQACFANDVPVACHKSAEYVMREPNLSPKRRADARKYYIKACEGGFTDSCFPAANMLERGEGGPVDLAKAISFHAKACDSFELKSCDAYNRLAGD